MELRDLPEPEPKPGELLMRVRATALNRADLYPTQGHPPDPIERILYPCGP